MFCVDCGNDAVIFHVLAIACDCNVDNIVVLVWVIILCDVFFVMIGCCDLCADFVCNGVGNDFGLWFR